MRYRSFMVGAILVLALSLAQAGQPPRIGALIDQLGGDSFVEREEARTQLEAIGPPALAALRQAAKSGNLEMARRAAALIRAIDDRRLTAAILAPKKVRLKVVNVPVLDAVARLSQLAGYPIRVDGDRLPLAGKTVTLDTGLVTFWEALDRLDAQAGLVAKLTVAALPGDASVEASAVSPSCMLPKMPRQPPPLEIVKLPAKLPDTKNEAKNDARPTAPLPGLVILTPGKVAGRHVHYAGAARVVLRRAPPTRRSAKHHDLVLDASAEPRVLGFSAGSAPTITRAIDEHGQALAFVVDPPAVGPAPPVPNASLYGILMAPVGRPPARPGITIRLQQGQKRAKKLRELTGTLPAQVLMPGTQLAAIDHVLKAVGKSVDVLGGGRLEFVGIAKTTNGAADEGVYSVTLKLDGVPGLGDGNDLPYRNNRLFVNRCATLTAELFDAKDHGLAVVSTATTDELHPETQTIKRVITVQFCRAKGQGEPARLVLTGTHLRTIAIPFRFVDVPLP